MPAEFPSPAASFSNSGFDLAWQTAQERVLLYLRACEIPAHQALEIAVIALKRARSSSDRAALSPPAAAVMHEALTIINEMVVSEPSALKACPGGTRLFPQSLSSVPPLKRGSMGSRRNWHRSWLTRPFSLFRRSRGRAGREGTLLLFSVMVGRFLTLFLMIVPR